MMTSLISGLPRRDTCVQPRLSFPPTVTFRRSVDDQMPIVCRALSSWLIGICSATEWTL